MRKLRAPARIIDIDGTLADVRGIQHLVRRVQGQRGKDFSEYHKHSPYAPAVEQALAYIRETVELGMIPVVLTSRREMWFAETKAFLDRVVPGVYEGPYMRPDDDFSSDFECKEHLLKYLERHYDIRGAIEDNPKVIAMMEARGITVEVVPGYEEWELVEVVA